PENPAACSCGDRLQRTHTGTAASGRGPFRRSRPVSAAQGGGRMMALRVDDFSEFFTGIHGHPPFPWQVRLASQVVADGTWPSLLDLPTASGKTAAIDIAVFHLAMDADRGEQRRAPVRIAFV